MSGCREGRPQPEIVANNFRLYTTPAEVFRYDRYEKHR